MTKQKIIVIGSGFGGPAAAARLAARGHAVEVFEKRDHLPQHPFVHPLMQLAHEQRRVRVPHPCGWFNDPVKQCTCAPAAVTRYQKRISGPLLDRIDTLRVLKCPESII